MERIYALDTIKNKGKKALLKGWVHARRDMGKLTFIDLRDKSGLVQVVFTPSDLSKEEYDLIKQVRIEWILEVEGEVQKRHEQNINKEIPTGQIEVLAKKVNVISQAENPPFELDKDTRGVNEEIRMKYRYLDLRTQRMLAIMQLRHQVNQFIHDFFTKKGFLEIETPILSKSTPEGARDFLVPSRNFQRKFYALPQAPQQYKQLLMVAGIERYYQIARCFRDEDTRKDRQPEFTQLDLEMSFVEREDVMKINEEMLIKLVETVTPEKKIQEIPFPWFTFKEVMDKYNTDRPDLRKDKKDMDTLAFCWVTDFPFFEKTDEGEWTFTHNPFSAPLPEFEDDLMKKKNIGEIITSQYDVVMNGFEIGGGSIRNHQPEALTKVLEILGMDKKKIQEQFGHILNAFKYGTPSHGGIAYGLDRVIAILANEYDSIREVIAFPKTAEGKDPLMDAPAEVSREQLNELGIT